MTASHELYNWHLVVVSGEIQRKSGSIILQDESGQEKVRWNFCGARPSKWDGPAFSAKGNDVANDTLIVSCERVERA